MIPEIVEIPWFWPVTVAMVGVATFFSMQVARSFGTTQLHAFVLLVSIGGIVALTLTPAGDSGGHACRIPSSWLISLGDFVPPNDRGLNVVLFIPLGIALGLMPRSPVKAEAVFLAALSPLLIELTQSIVGLGRTCEATDVVDNLTGLAVGFLIAGVVGVVLRRWRRVDDGPPGANTSGARG
jgi:glycopeptide antibiotics resistance protein